MGEETHGKVRTENGFFSSVEPRRYYLYFAHHKGSYIRLAYGDAVAGPWTVYEPGVLSLEVVYWIDLNSFTTVWISGVRLSNYRRRGWIK